MRVDEAANGEQALDILAKVDADVVIADYQTARMDALDLTKAICNGGARVADTELQDPWRVRGHPADARRAGRERMTR